MAGPLTGVRIVEFTGIGPGPFAGMLLADMGAEILRIDRKGAKPARDPRLDALARGRRSVALDLKRPEGVAAALKAIDQADALIEGFRPGVMERLGLGPEVCHARNPKLVFGRMTGWGQDGPLAQAAGHDINYISLSGALWAIGDGDRKPVPPLNVVGDFGGGGAYLAFGIVCALLRARQTGEGDVVDAAIVDGAASLMGMMYSMLNAGDWRNERSANLLDGGAPFYGTYACADGKWVSIAPLEPQFWALFMEMLGLAPDHFGDRHDRSRWPEMRAAFEEIFRSKTRAEWTETFEGTDVCFAPVLDLEEARAHPHNVARGILIDTEQGVQPAPAPRFARAAVATPKDPPPRPGEHNDVALDDWGFSAAEVAALRESGAM